MALKFVQSNTLYQAGAGNIVGATTIILTSFADIYGNVLTMTDFGAKGYATCEPDTTNEEAFTFTGVTANANGTYTLTGVSSALAKSPYTEASGLVRQHSGGTKVVITDNVAFWNTFANKINDEVITGQWSKTQAPVANDDIPNKAYVDGVAVAGASNANTTTKGIVELATQAEMDARTTTGGTGAALVPTPDIIRSTKTSDYALDTGSANTCAIAPTPVITAYSAGQKFVFKVATANTGATTLNVNAVGAVTIKKFGSIDLATGDLVVGQIVEVMHDGINFQLLTPLAANELPTGTINPYAGITAPTGWLLCDGTAVSRTTYANLLAVISPAKTFTVTIASPGVFSCTAHGLQIGDKIRLTTTGALPTGLAAATDYFVISAGFTANVFEVSASRGGAAVNTSGTQSGTHTLRYSNWGVGDGSTTFNVPDLRGLTIYGQKTSDTNFDNMNSPTVYPGEKTHVLTVAELASHFHTNAGFGGGAGGSTTFNVSSNTSGTGNTGSTGSDTAHNNMPPYAVAQYIIKI